MNTTIIPIIIPVNKTQPTCPSCGKNEEIIEVCKHCAHEYENEEGGIGLLPIIFITVLVSLFLFIALPLVDGFTGCWIDRIYYTHKYSNHDKWAGWKLSTNGEGQYMIYHKNQYSIDYVRLTVGGVSLSVKEDGTVFPDSIQAYSAGAAYLEQSHAQFK